MDKSQRELGYEAAGRAESHANRVVDPNWSAKADDALRAFLRASGGGSTFVASDAVRWCLAHGLPQPPDPRAFGAMIRRAAKVGIIRDTGRRLRVGSHGREVVLWVVVANVTLRCEQTSIMPLPSAFERFIDRFRRS